MITRLEKAVNLLKKIRKENKSLKKKSNQEKLNRKYLAVSDKEVIWNFYELIHGMDGTGFRK